MAEKIGIYITGLGQSFHQESVEKYAIRLKNELNYTITGFDYDLKITKLCKIIGKQND